MAKKKRRARVDRKAAERASLRELLYVMLQAACGGFSIDEEMLSDMPQAVGTVEWIRWVSALNAHFGMWSFRGPSETDDGKLFGVFFGVHELETFADFEKAVDRLFEAGARA